MDQKIAVLFMPDNIACTEEKTPLMLQPILFCPVLTWMCAELCGRGIERLFIVSDVSAQERMKPYLPKEADVTFVDGAKHAEELLKLLEGETGSILIVNGVVLPVGVCAAVYLTEYGSSAIEYSVRCWTRTEDYWTAFFALNENLRDAFAAAGVEMTYDHLNVHLVER